MKKIISLLLVLAIALALVACGSSQSAETQTTAAPAETKASEATEAPADTKKYEGVELTMWSMWTAGEAQAQVIQAAADAAATAPGRAFLSTTAISNPVCSPPRWSPAKSWTSSRMTTTVLAMPMPPIPTT